MTHNEYSHPVVLIYADGHLDFVMGLETFRQHIFYRKLICKEENITIADLDNCGDHLFSSEVSKKQWHRPEQTMGELKAMFSVEPHDTIFQFQFSRLRMDIEEVDKYHTESWHDSN